MSGASRDERTLPEALHATAQHMPAGDFDLYPLVAPAVRRRRWFHHRLLFTAVAVALVAGGAIAVTSMFGHRPDDAARIAPPGTGTSTPCPATFGAWRPGPLRAGVHDIFVPPGSQAVSICRYEAPKGAAAETDLASLALSRAGELSGSVLAELVTFLNKAPFGNMRCPRNPTAVVLARFHYPEGPDVEVRMGVAGCWNATNGARSAIVSGIAIPGFTGPATPPAMPKR